MLSASLGVKLGEGGPPNLLIQNGLQILWHPTNQGVGSSNLSGRATYLKVYSGYMVYRLFRIDALHLFRCEGIRCGFDPHLIPIEEA